MSKEKTHWMQSPNKNYLGHWDLPEKQDLVVEIESAQWEAVKNPITNKTESKRVVRFTSKDVKPMICNQTNAQAIVRATGVKYMEDSKGLKISLYVDSIRDKITKEEVDCIRVRPVDVYSLDVLQQKFTEKRSKIKDQALIVRIGEIIATKEKSSYSKVIQHLDKL